MSYINIESDFITMPIKGGQENNYCKIFDFKISNDNIEYKNICSMTFKLIHDDEYSLITKDYHLSASLLSGKEVVTLIDLVPDEYRLDCFVKKVGNSCSLYVRGTIGGKRIKVQVLSSWNRSFFMPTPLERFDTDKSTIVDTIIESSSSKYIKSTTNKLSLNSIEVNGNVKGYSKICNLYMKSPTTSIGANLLISNLSGGNVGGSNSIISVRCYRDSSNITTRFVSTIQGDSEKSVKPIKLIAIKTTDDTVEIYIDHTDTAYDTYIVTLLQYNIMDYNTSFSIVQKPTTINTLPVGTQKTYTTCQIGDIEMKNNWVKTTNFSNDIIKNGNHVTCNLTFNGGTTTDATVVGTLTIKPKSNVMTSVLVRKSDGSCEIGIATIYIDGNIQITGVKDNTRISINVSFYTT